MTLIACPDCRKKVSDQSATCVHCGYPIGLLAPPSATPTQQTAGRIEELNPDPRPIPAPAEPLPAECARSGRYRVTWENRATPGGSAYFPLKLHPDGPVLSTMRAYVGPLCPHEVEWLRREGNYTRDWTFVVRDLDAVAKRSERKAGVPA